MSDKSSNLSKLCVFPSLEPFFPVFPPPKLTKTSSEKNPSQFYNVNFALFSESRASVQTNKNGCRAILYVENTRSAEIRKKAAEIPKKS